MPLKRRILTALSAFLLGSIVASCNQTPSPKPPVKQHTPTVGATVTATTQTGQVIQYDTTPGASKSAIRVMVDDQEIFVEHYKDIDYSRFAFSGTVVIKVILNGPITQYTISPRSYQIQATQGANNLLSFSLSQPEKLILQFGPEKLFLLSDPPEQDVPKIGDANVIDITQYVKDKSGNTIETAQIQQAIDDASAKHGIVYFPSGKYPSGTLDIKSNVSLYLSSGALLMGTGRLADYTGHFLWFNASSNAKLYGRGVIDLGGSLLRRLNNSKGRVKLIRTVNANTIELQDVLLRDSGSWTVHIVDSNDVTVSNVKIINDINTTNNDGIDPDDSSNVTIDGAFVYTGDDCFAVKTSGDFGVPRDSHTILIKNAVCHVNKSALKVGTETRANLSDISFTGNTVVHADRAIALYMEDGSAMTKISYLNTTSEQVGGDAKRRLIDINISKRRGIGTIGGVTITNYSAEQFGSSASAIVGMAGHNIDVTIKNMQVAGQQLSTAEAAKITVQNANLVFQAGS